jgi:hypothetical protein
MLQPLILKAFALASNQSSITDNQDGLTATFSRPGANFDIVELSDGPPSFGQRTLSPFNNPVSNTSFLVNFSSELSSVSLEAGNFEGGLLDADVITLSIFSGFERDRHKLGLNICQLRPSRGLPERRGHSLFELGRADFVCDFHRRKPDLPEQHVF